MLPSKELFLPIRCVISDVDGVLTNGQIIVSEQQHEIKVFHVQDGLGILWLQKQGIPFAVITGRTCKAVEMRMKSLGVEYIYQGHHKKLSAFEDILQRLQLKSEEIAYVGDDLPDILLMKRVGLAIAVANASPETKAHAHWVTQASGGAGAIREVAVELLKAKGLYENVLADYDV